MPPAAPSGRPDQSDHLQRRGRQAKPRFLFVQGAGVLHAGKQLQMGLRVGS